MTVASFALRQLRHFVWERAEGICGLCAEPVALEVMHIDHIVPRSLGGEDALNNFQPAHPRCNIQKGGRRNYSPGPPHPQPAKMSRMPPPKDGLTTRQVAEWLQVSRPTIHKWIKAGRLQAVYTGNRRVGYLIPASEVERLLAG